MILSKNIAQTSWAMVLVFTSFTLSAQTQTLTSLGFSVDQQTALRTGEPLQSTVKTVSEMALLPQGMLQQTLLTTVNTRGSKDVIESLTLIPTPRLISPLVLLNGLLDAPAMSGMKFYSRSEKATITLIYEAFVIAGASDRQRIDPPQLRTLPETFEMFIWQDDETFGEKVYKITVATHPASGEILLFNINVDKLTQGPITMAQPGDMRSLGWFIPTNEGLLVYQVVVNTQGVPGFVRKKAHESMFNRLNAYITWLKTSILK